MMKHILLPVLLAGSFYAQATFVPVSLSGFNHDAIANGVGNASASTTLAVDQASWALVAPDFKAVAGNAAPAAALPATGLINSVATAGLTYQLANYTGSNDLIINTTSTPRTLTFNTICGGDVYVLGFTGNGPTTADIKVNFTDNTSETFTGISFADWYGGTGFAIQNIGRVDRSNNTLEAPAGDPRLYEKKLALSAANTGKIIASITVTKTNATGVLNIVAVSVCQSPLISTQPSDRVICKNWNTFFQVAATVVSSYQWQVNTGAGFTNVTNNAIYSGATTTQLALTQTPAAYNTYQYRCAMKSSCGATVYSKTVTLTVTPDVKVTSIPSSVTMCTGGPATVQLSHTGTAINYKWQVKTMVTGFYVDLADNYPYSGTGTAQLDIAKAPDSLQNAVLRCIMTGDCNTETSADIAVSMVPSPYISQDPVDDNILPYENAKFEVMVDGSSEYQLYWQASENGTDFVNINDNSLYVGSKNIALAVLNVQPSLNGLKVRCLLKSTNPVCGGLRDTSEIAKINIEFPNKIEDANAATGRVSFYPNPVKDMLHITVAGNKEGTYTITDVAGKIIGGGILQPGKQQVNLAALPVGTYLLRYAVDAEKSVIKLVKE